MSASTDQREHALERAQKVFRIVAEAARRREACPSNAVMAERLGCRPNTISRALNFLETAGMIAVERGASARTVEICATGARTA